jgi:TadE-like protein
VERPSQRESGQAAVESALILPLMVFMVLGLLQLTMVQQAKLMTEYAAYQAARAGVVWNGNNERMHDAALMAILPTLGRTDSLANVGVTWLKATAYDMALQQLPWGTRQDINGAYLRGLVRVDLVNPAEHGQINGIWKLRSANNWRELDFDGPDTYPEIPNLEPRLAKFFNLATPDAAERTYRRATVLQIRLRYWYDMRIPFANHVVFLSWFASNAQVALYGSIDRSSLTRQNMLGRNGSTTALGAMGRGLTAEKGYAPLTGREMMILWGLADGSIPLVSAVVGKRYFMPLTATYSMRMQSNFYRKWSLHQNPGWAL